MSDIEIAIDGAVATVTLNRPEKRNAITDPMRATLTECFAEFDRNPEIRVIVLTGNGPAFCAGTDLSAGGQAPQTNPIALNPRLTAPLDACSKPILAAVNGTAVGGGLELVLACDMRIAATTAKFGLTEVKIGSLAGSGGTQRLPHAMGRALAAEMLFTGETISADRALSAGLVSAVHEPADLAGAVKTLAATVAQNAPLSLIAVKRALKGSLDLTAGLELERALFGALLLTEDRKEGRLAFRERRAPQFQGR